MRALKPTSQFKRDLRKAKRQGRDIDLLEEIVGLLQEGARLDKQHRDHGLTGNWNEHRECHITPDWLLIYRLTDDALILVRNGSHAELFS